MKLKDISNLTRNKSNLQFSLNLKAKELKKLGVTPQNLLELKLPDNFKLIKNNLKVQQLKSLKGGINNKWNKKDKK